MPSKSASRVFALWQGRDRDVGVRRAVRHWLHRFVRGRRRENSIARYFGEMVENVASSGEYHWMAGNYIEVRRALTAKDLPWTRELIAALRRRPVFISVGSQQVEGGWVDARHVHGRCRCWPLQAAR